MIKKIFDYIKNKVGISNVWHHQTLYGSSLELSFDFGKPVTSEDILFFESHNFTLPAAYKDFLLCSNGFTLYIDKELEQASAGIKIHGLSEIIPKTQEIISWGYDIPSNCYVFAESLGDPDFLLIDLNAYQNRGRNYILDGDTSDPPKNWRYLQGDFESFLERLILAEGTKYWRWVC